MLELNIPNGIRHTSTGVVYPPGLSLEQLSDHRRFCARAHAASVFWLTDNSREILRNFGEEALQKTVALVEVEQGQARAEQALLQLEVRLTDCLSPDHYVELGQAKLDAAGQQSWLDTAVREKLSPRELRRSIVAGAVVRTQPHASGNAGVPTPHAARAQFDFWRREIGEGWRGWEDETLKMVIGELEAIADFVLEVKVERQRRSEKVEGRNADEEVAA